MLSFKEYLLEFRAPEVNTAYELLDNISFKARYAIINWESHQWVTGELEEAYKKGKGDLYDEVEKNAEKLRNIIRDVNGDHMTLYRGLKSDGDAKKHKGRILHSWTTRKKVAALFAGLAMGNGARDIKLHKDIKTPNFWLISLTDRKARQIQDNLIKNGTAIYKKFLFKINQMNDDFFNVYKKIDSGGYSFFSDGYKIKLAEWLISYRDEEIKFQKKTRKRGMDTGYIVQDRIPVKDIVWVLNNGTYSGTLEYIVKNNSGINSKRVNL